MGELRRKLRFAPERAHRPIVPRDAGVKRLQRHLALERQIPRAPDGAEGAASELRKNLVVVADRPTHTRLGGFHGAAVRLSPHHGYSARWITAIDGAKQNRERRVSIR